MLSNLNTILNMDCYDFLKQCPDKYFDLILTDPPYGISCDGGGYGLGVKPKILDKKQWDNDIPIKAIFEQMFRVSKNQIIFGGNYFTEYLKPTKSWIFWDKIGTYKLKNNFSEGELIWTSYNKVTRKITFVQQGFINDDKTENKLRFHPTQKPVGLLKQIIKDYSNENDLILDCFSGSGSTAIACWEMKRNFICIEKDKDYYDLSLKRLKSLKMKKKLF